MNHLKRLAEQFRDFTVRRGEPSYYGYLLDHENTGVQEPLTPIEKAHVKEAVRGIGVKAQQCFMNAQRLTLYDGSGLLKYHEGIFCWDDLSVPIDHAWNTINGKIVDVTVEANNRRRNKQYQTKKNTPLQYLGVTVPSSEEIMKLQLKTQRYTQISLLTRHFNSYVKNYKAKVEVAS